MKQVLIIMIFIARSYSVKTDDVHFHVNNDASESVFHVDGIGAVKGKGNKRLDEQFMGLGCTLQYSPVCGINGRDYGSSCRARSAGVEVACQGRCPCLAIPGPLHPPMVRPDPRCAMNPQLCHCSQEQWDCSRKLKCKWNPQLRTCDKVFGCTMHYAPVCGINGRDYGSSCRARSAGVEVACQGRCPCLAIPGPLHPPMVRPDPRCAMNPQLCHCSQNQWDCSRKLKCKWQPLLRKCEDKDFCYHCEHCPEGMCRQKRNCIWQGGLNFPGRCASLKFSPCHVSNRCEDCSQSDCLAKTNCQWNQFKHTCQSTSGNGGGGDMNCSNVRCDCKSLNRNNDVIMQKCCHCNIGKKK